MQPSTVSIIGAGLAGCEAALQLANNGVKVVVYDKKPNYYSSPYAMENFAELVCNNSLCARRNDNPKRLLVSELSVLGSELIAIAEQSTVQDDLYIAVDKKIFSELVTDAIKQNQNITLCNRYCKKLPDSEIVIVASGPTTDKELLDSISSQYGLHKYHFSDSSCAIIDINSIDLSDPNIRKESDDLYAVQIPEVVFSRFSQGLAARAKKPIHEIDNIPFILSHSIEALASKGAEELKKERFSHDDRKGPCLLLRRDGALENGFIMVGCMTTLCHRDQQFVFSLLPGFSNVKILRYGRMHANTFFQSPGHLNSFYQVKGSNIFIVGQLSGIDGYAPAISSGFVAAQKILFGNDLPVFPRESMIGALANYVSNEGVTDYQPMCAEYSLIPGQDDSVKPSIALQAVHAYSEELNQQKAKQRNTIST